jgi:hypothetical protein
MKLLYNRKNSDSFLASLSYLNKHYKQYKKYWRLYLLSQNSYVSTTPIIRKFTRKKYLISSINTSFQCDLAVMSTIFGENLPKHNKNIRYLLIFVDMLSRFIYVYKLTSKSSQAVAKQMQSFLSMMKGSVQDLMCDFGGEFYGSHTKNVLKKWNVNLYSSKNTEIKSGLVENKIKYLKSKIFKYISNSGNYNYVSVLPNIVSSINNTVNRVLGLAPSEITRSHESYLFTKLHRSYFKKTLPKFKENYLVRISRTKKHFEKLSTYYKWGQEIFIIDKILKSSPITYQIKDFEHNVILGSFYSNELTPVILDKNKHNFKILRQNKHSVYIHLLSHSKNTKIWVHRNSMLF